MACQNGLGLEGNSAGQTALPLAKSTPVENPFNTMRQLFPLFLLIATMLYVGHALAEEAESGVLSGLRKQAEPLLYALSLIGTPYKPGGTDPAKGTDCSGFVRHVYKQTAGISLPHNAKAMSQTSASIAKEELKPGDLVFFNTRKRPFSHVGIYAGDGKFVHSTSSRSKEVQVSSLDDRYWARSFNGARRIPSLQ